MRPAAAYISELQADFDPAVEGRLYTGASRAPFRLMAKTTALASRIGTGAGRIRSTVTTQCDQINHDQARSQSVIRESVRKMAWAPARRLC